MPSCNISYKRIKWWLCSVTFRFNIVSNHTCFCQLIIHRVLNIFHLIYHYTYFWFLFLFCKDLDLKILKILDMDLCLSQFLYQITVFIFYYSNIQSSFQEIFLFQFSVSFRNVQRFCLPWLFLFSFFAI